MPPDSHIANQDQFISVRSFEIMFTLISGYHDRKI